MGGIKVWFDWDVFRLNHDGRGEFIGEFQGNERLLVVNKDGEYFISGFDPSTHLGDNILLLQKFEQEKVFTAAYFDGEQDLFYVKRFTFEPSDKPQSFISNGGKSYLVSISSDSFPCLQVVFGGKNASREKEDIDVEEFIGVKSFKAKGKRVSNYQVKAVSFIEPLQKETVEQPEANIEEVAEEETPIEPQVDKGSTASQMTLEL